MSIDILLPTTYGIDDSDWLNMSCTSSELVAHRTVQSLQGGDCSILTFIPATYYQILGAVYTTMAPSSANRSTYYQYLLISAFNSVNWQRTKYKVILTRLTSIHSF